MKVAVADLEPSSDLNSAPAEPSSKSLEAEDFGRPHAMVGRAMDSGATVRAALKAGLLGAVVAVLIPIVGIVLAGALAVFLYRRENGIVLPVRLGLRAGGAAGVVAFAVYSAFMASVIVLTHSQQKYMDDAMAMARKFGADPADPNLQASFHSVFTPAGLAFAFILGMMFAVVIASGGGALASWLLGPHKPRG